MLKVDQDLTRVLVLQDKVGTRQSGHFDHDANAMSGPVVRGSRKTKASRSAAVSGQVVATVRIKLDPDSGEYLGI
jgi:hypothetical protein